MTDPAQAVRLCAGEGVENNPSATACRMQTVGPTTWGTVWQHPVEWNRCLLKKCGRLIAESGPNSAPHMLPPYSFGVTCHSSFLEVDFIPQPLILGGLVVCFGQ